MPQSEIETQVQYLLDEIRSKRKIGMVEEQIRASFAANPFAAPPQDVVEEAFGRYDRAAGRIREYKSVTTVREDEIRKGGWYDGPDFKGAVYWPALKTELTKKLGNAVDEVDMASSKVVESLRPPGEESFDTRGLVLGYVQSGKTTNFVSVIAKAADAGYRLFIVLAGLTNNLREQTQERIEDQLLTKTSHWHKLTFRDSDFRAYQDNTIKNAATILGNPDTRVIAVVKKNGSILRKLNRFINAAKDSADSCPILIIDDEADQASINVSAQAKNEVSAINAQIRELLRNQKTAYVAYTATPFANILINPNENDDIYPRNFIHVLPKPKGYFGSETIFGREPMFGHDPESKDGEDGYDMIRTIPSEEEDYLRPPSRKEAIASWEPQVPDSLLCAMKWFVLATAARRYRGQATAHSSMLIHTAMRTIAHQETAQLLETELRELRNAWGRGGELEEELRSLWEEETIRVNGAEFGHNNISFDKLKDKITDVLREVEIVMDNGYSEERLEYPEDTTKTVIAVGGNTLSRGLTLEGLICSYFVRNATAYDTLLQMGRWFGFRAGYEDLPRIWLTKELAVWFRDLALVEADLRQDLSRYARDGITPLDFQARVRVHPAMEITSRAKQQSARMASVSFSGQKVQTILFRHKNVDWLKGNLEATRKFGEQLQQFSKPKFRENNGTVVFRHVAPELVVKFLRSYKFYEESFLGENNAEKLLAYIEKEHSSRSIREWSVSFYGRSPGGKQARDIDLHVGYPIRVITRSQMMDSRPEVANIKTLVGSLDRLNDAMLDAEQLKAVTEEVSSADESREAIIVEKHAELVGSDVGHLTIYAIDKESKTRQPADYRYKSGKNAGELIPANRQRKHLNAEEDLIGVGIFFPESTNEDSSVEYKSAPPPDQETYERYAAAEEEIQQITGNEEDEK